jgi:transmembrane sensor
VTNYLNYEVEDFLHDDFFIDWVLKGTSQHNAFWDEWLLNNPGKIAVVEKARSIVSSVTVKPLDTTLSDTEVDEIVAYIKNRLHNNKADGAHIVPVKFYQSTYFKVAAMLLVLVSIGFLFVKLKPANSPQLLQQANSATDYLSVVNTSANSKVVLMSDGSLAVLKPGSRLKYLRSFAKKRDVILNGEAFFEVHKNHAIPFLVHSNDMVVRVVGTSFTVKSQKDKQAFNVIVNTGKVLVYDSKKATAGTNSQNSVTLVPNQQVTYQPQLLKFKKETLPVPLILSEEIAPKEFTFDNTPFSVIVEKISKVYDVDIEYDKAKLGNISINASISQKPLDEKVKLICKAVNATYEFIDGRIIISTQN